MYLYAHQALKNAFSVIIQTVDTDVLVSAIGAAARGDNKHLWSPNKALPLKVSMGSQVVTQFHCSNLLEKRQYAGCSSLHL